MPDFLLLFRSISQQASMQGWKSTALQMHNWGLLLAYAALLFAATVHASLWLMILLAVMASIMTANWIYSHNYLLVHNTDALRSERYTLSKMAIQRSVTGDTITGLKELGIDDLKLLPSTETASDIDPDSESSEPQ